ncbi:MAG: 30S ribosomal protein S20 [Elusimicrobia bacterium]|nr:30S ribosomal protein S20 [Elusimicrobiota bacterium]
MVKLPTGRHTQSIKSARKNREKYEINKALRSKTKTYVKKINSLVSAGDQKAAVELLPEVYKCIDMASSDGAFHRNRASRLKSRLTKKVNSLKT